MSGPMICQECGQRAATFHVTRVVNDQKLELHLCEQCARERGELEFLLEPKFSIHNLLAGFLEQGLGRRAPQAPTTSACPRCGLTYKQFAQTGLLGCSHCYETFAAALEPIVRRVHGSDRHVGKAPRTAAAHDDAPARKLERLRQALQRAVAEERYEDAARLRDDIRALERRLAGGSGTEAR